jgi:hypothetical protein
MFIYFGKNVIHKKKMPWWVNHSLIYLHGVLNFANKYFNNVEATFYDLYSC